MEENRETENVDNLEGQGEVTLENTNGAQTSNIPRTAVGVAKENIVGTMGILYGGSQAYTNMAQVFTHVTGMSFLIFNLLCAPCFAAMGAIKREMNSTKWFWFAIGYECGFAYIISFIVNQIGSLCTGAVSGVIGIIEVVLGFVVLAGLVYMVCRKDKYKK